MKPGRNEKNVPGHVAILMEGSSRWASERGLLREDGYLAASEAALQAAHVLRERGVRHLTLCAPDLASRTDPDEVRDPLTRTLVRVASEREQELREAGMRVRVFGDLDELPLRARKAVERLMDSTRTQERMTLWLALSYTARKDVADAARALAARVRVGLLLPEEIDEQSIRAAMTTAELPDVDLVLRTSGAPLGDILLFESARAEVCSTDALWPDVGERALEEALGWYARRREQRLGPPAPRRASPSRTRGRSGAKLDVTNQPVQWR